MSASTGNETRRGCPANPNNRRNAVMSDRFRAFAGIDWASQVHQVCAIDEEGVVLGERAVPHSGAGLASLGDWLITICQARPEEIAVAIEVPHGPVVETMLERDFAVHALNPKQLDRFRDRFTVAGAKDDRRDALVLASSLATDRHCYRRVRIDQPLIIELRECSRMLDGLKAERSRLVNHVREQLWRYFPQALQVTDDPGADWFLELWSKVPTPDKAKHARQASVAKILEAHRIRRISPSEILERLRQPALVVAAGTWEAASIHIQYAAERLTVVNRQIRQAEARLVQLCRLCAEADGMQRDVEILSSLPGIGKINRATLLAEAFQPLQARDYHALRSLSGVAPVTRSSGKRRLVVMRLACHRRLRNAVYHWARVAVQVDSLCRTKYAALRARGHSHGRALRSVADRLLKVACTMLQNQTLYDPDYATKDRQIADYGGVTAPPICH